MNTARTINVYMEVEDDNQGPVADRFGALHLDVDCSTGILIVVLNVEDAFCIEQITLIRSRKMTISATSTCQEDTGINLHNIVCPTDSTSVHEIRLVVDEDCGSALGNEELFSKVQGLMVLEDDEWKTQNLDEVVNDLRAFLRSANRFFNQNNGLRTKYFIMLGSVLRRVKQIVRDNGENWEDWIEAKMGRQVRRSVGDYMTLAGIDKIQEYAFLGKARLMRIATAVRQKIKQGEADPIGDFLQSANITFDPQEDEEVSLEATQTEIDAELIRWRLAKEELPDIDTDKLKEMAEAKINLTSDMIKALKQEKASDGDTSQLLGNIIDNKGKLPDQYQKAMLPEHFNSRSVSLKKSVDKFIGDDDLLAVVDPSLLDSLIASLATLKAKIQAAGTATENQDTEN